MKDRLSKTIKRLEKQNIIKSQNNDSFKKGLGSIEVKIFRQLQKKYDLSVENNHSSEVKVEDDSELSNSAKKTLERIKKGEKFKI
jgi:hypothetical protein